MRKVITFAIIMGIVFLLASCSTRYEQSVTTPISKEMELVCITPHGHQVYRYIDYPMYQTNPTYIYVVIRHSDGMPLAMSVAPRSY